MLNFALYQYPSDITFQHLLIGGMIHSNFSEVREQYAMVGLAAAGIVKVSPTSVFV